MFYSVEDLALKFKVSKVTIYSKLKLENINPFVVKKQGKTMIDEDGLILIEESLKLKNDLKNNNDIEDEIAADLRLDINLIDILNNEIDFLREQLKEKDKQLEKENKLVENMQVLLKQEQDRYKNEALLESHFKDIDKKLLDLKQNMSIKKNDTNIFRKLFKKDID